MKKDKLIKVDNNTHRMAKTRASREGKTLKEYVRWMIDKDSADIVLNVSQTKSDILIYIFDDIINEMSKREDKCELSEDEINNFTYQIENIPFVGNV